jgi:hypothetical protein
MLPTVMTNEMQIGHPTLLLDYYPQPAGLGILVKNTKIKSYLKVLKVLKEPCSQLHQRFHEIFPKF